MNKHTIKNMLVGSLFSAFMLLSSISSKASPTNSLLPSLSDDDKWTFSLAGGGSSPISGNNSSVAGGELQLGHTAKFILPLETGLRQGFDYSSHETFLTTKYFVDFTIVKFGNLEFDAGVNAGAGYGDTKLSWSASPEVVTRLYLKKDVDLFARVEYPFDLSNSNQRDTLVYTLGFRLKF